MSNQKPEFQSNQKPDYPAFDLSVGRDNLVFPERSEGRMPNYEYECLECGHHFEIFQMMTDVPIKTCPKCQKPVRRLIGMGSGIIFKGAGFYATDYRKTKPSQAAEERKGQKTCQQDKSSNNKKTPDPKNTESSCTHD